MRSRLNRSIRILCIDPDRDFLVNVKQRAVDRGAQIDTYDSFASVLNGDTDAEYDLIVCNAEMLLYAGKEMVGQLAELYGDVPMALQYDDDNVKDSIVFGRITAFFDRSKTYDETVLLMISEAAQYARDSMNEVAGF